MTSRTVVEYDLPQNAINTILASHLPFETKMEHLVKLEASICALWEVKLTNITPAHLTTADDLVF